MEKIVHNHKLEVYVVSKGRQNSYRVYYEIGCIFGKK